jgi:hypothetical protein
LAIGGYLSKSADVLLENATDSETSAEPYPHISIQFSAKSQGFGTARKNLPALRRYLA